MYNELIFHPYYVPYYAQPGQAVPGKPAVSSSIIMLICFTPNFYPVTTQFSQFHSQSSKYSLGKPENHLIFS